MIFGGENAFIHWAVAAGCSAFSTLAWLAATAPLQAAEKNGYQVSGFAGSFSTGVSVAAPPFHGIEPRISLSYSSEGRNGFVGLGWSLNGFSQIAGRNEVAVIPGGWPTGLFLDGQQIVACPASSTFPSCAAGGTHYTRHESYLKIVKVDDDHWTVYGKDGTQTKFVSQGYSGDYPWKFGQSETKDTHGNTVTYTWWNPDGGVANWYPSTASYNGYTVEFLYETSCFERTSWSIRQRRVCSPQEAATTSGAS